MLAPLGMECNGHFCAQTLCGDLIIILFHCKDNTEHYFDPIFSWWRCVWIKCLSFLSLFIQTISTGRANRCAVFSSRVYTWWIFNVVKGEHWISICSSTTHTHTQLTCSTDLHSLKFTCSMIWSGLIILSVKMTYTRIWICYQTLKVFLLRWYELEEKSSLRPAWYKKHLNKFIKTSGKKAPFLW